MLMFTTAEASLDAYIPQIEEGAGDNVKATLEGPWATVAKEIHALTSKHMMVMSEKGKIRRDKALSRPRLLDNRLLRNSILQEVRRHGFLFSHL